MDDCVTGTRAAFRRQHGLALAGNDDFALPADARILKRSVRRHRLAGLWAADLAPAWRSYAAAQALYAARCVAIAERVHTQFTQKGAPVVVIKGPILAQQAWPQPGLRNYDDVDIRCSRMPYAALATVLQKADLHPELQDAKRQAARWRFGWGVGFVGEEQVRVECNWRMFPPHYPWPRRLDPDRMQDAVPCALDHDTVMGPSPALHLLYSCLHALWHGWDRLAWVVDMAGLLVRHPDSLAQARRLAGRHGFLRQALNAGCDLSDSLLGPLPGVRDVDLGLRSPQAVFCCAPRRNSFATRRKEHMHCMNRAERLRYTIRRVFTPGDPDFRLWRLPTGLHGMYWCLRPVRIAAHCVDMRRDRCG